MLTKLQASLLGGAAILVAALTGSLSLAQPTEKAIPAECLPMNLTPYSALESLDISPADHPRVHFNVEIADNDAHEEQGLMCRQNLADTYGMLFEFTKADEQTFWMHNTLVGLDIIYIAPDGRIVSIAKNAKPLDDTPLPSHGNANGVLEINAGLSDRLGLKPGDQVIHPFFHKP